MATNDDHRARSPHRAPLRRALRVLRLAQSLLVLAAILSISAPAAAIPAFARKYGTSCVTCHTIFPKLNPFGEAFRRNNYRFPGVDSDFVKQDPTPLGQEQYKKQFPNAVWPGNLPANPLSFGFLGNATFHPDVNSSGGQADNGTAITTKDLVAEAHIWAGGSFDDNITFWGEVTFGTDGTVAVEHAAVFFNDLFFGPHVLNLRVGKTGNTLHSFGMHSSYVADTYLPPLGVTALFGATTDSWNAADKYTGIELNGVVGGRFIYALGFNAGATNPANLKNSQDLYAHLGAKIGGLRLDGEGGGASNAARPWAENALTLDLFGVRASNNYQPLVAAGVTPPNLDDVIYSLGGSLRAQLGSLELNAGAYMERHSAATSDAFPVNAITQFDELSYVIFPWLVPAVRVEYSRLSPRGTSAIPQGGVAGTGTLSDLRFIPGIAALVRPNVRFTLVAQFEHAEGAFPAGGSWAAATGAANVTDPAHPIKFENEALSLGLWLAF